MAERAILAHHAGVDDPGIWETFSVDYKRKSTHDLLYCEF